jgi:Family of unknown function (DUF6221)
VDLIAFLAFLAARLDEDEAAAETWREHDLRPLREVEAKRAILAEHQPGEYDRYGRVEVACRVCVTGHEAYMDDDAPDPWPCLTVRHLAGVYSDHPDYDPAGGG